MTYVTKTVFKGDILVFYGIGDSIIRFVVAKTGSLSEVSFPLRRYPGTSTLNHQNGTRGGRIPSTKVSYHLSGKLLSQCHGR